MKFMVDQNVYVKRLFALFSLNLIILIIAILSIIGIYIGTKVKICNTIHCVFKGEQVYLNQKRSVKPCDDFYEFACGNQKRNEIYLNKNQFHKFYEKDISNNKSLYRETDSKINDGIEYLKSFLNKCVDGSGVESDRIKSLAKTLNCPICKEFKESWHVDSYNYEKLITAIIDKNINFAAFFRFYINYPLAAHERLTPITPEYIITAPRLSDLEKPLKDHIQKLLKVLNNYHFPWRDDDIKHIEDLYNRLFYTGKRQLINFEQLPLHEKINYSTLKKKFKHLFSYEIVKKLVKGELNDDTTFYITRSEKELKILKNADDILDKPNDEEKRAITNYVIYIALLFANGFIHKNYDRNIRIETCLNILPAAPRLLFAFRMLYLMKHMTKKMKYQMIEFTNNIVHELRLSFDRQTWLDDKSKKYSIEKLKNLTIFIGVPNEYLQKKTLNEKPFTNLPEFNINDSLYDTCLKLIKSYKEYLGEQVGNANSKLWQFDTSEEIVSYIHMKNTLLLSIELVQSETSLANLPPVIRYGSLGPFIAAKLTQGFDILGQYFEKSGNYDPWWTNNTYYAFMKRSDCIRNQYDKYEEPLSHIKVSGDGTFQENIADNDGVKILYNAYKSFISQHDGGSTIPAFPNYKPKQVFWLLYAQAYCSLHKTKFLQGLFSKSYFAPARFRVIGTLVNSREFANDYKCSRNSKMNPSNKCIVWS